MVTQMYNLQYVLYNDMAKMEYESMFTVYMH